MVTACRSYGHRAQTRQLKRQAAWLQLYRRALAFSGNVWATARGDRDRYRTSGPHAQRAGPCCRNARDKVSVGNSNVASALPGAWGCGANSEHIALLARWSRTTASKPANNAAPCNVT